MHTLKEKMRGTQAPRWGRPLMAIALALLVALPMMAQRVTLNYKQAKLKTVLADLTRQTGLKVAYANGRVDTNQTVSVELANVELPQPLTAVLKNTGITFTTDSRQIYLRHDGDSQGSGNTGHPVKRRKVTGTVSDAMGEVIGASVKVKGETMGTVTDMNGNFQIDAPEGATLVISYIGMRPEEVKIDNRTSYEISMKADEKVIEEVVVVGYGTVKKRDVSTAISSIKASDIADRPNSDFRQAMVGKMPGVQVLQTGGDPEGSNLMVRVRGVGSATAGTEPLYVVDGVPMENGLSNLNPNDIEQMEVLKDASSAAIYGSRGANGVILVTTKKGKTDRVSVSYDAYVGVENVSKKIDMLNAYQFAQLAKEAHTNAYLDLHPGGTLPNGQRPESYGNYPLELEPYLAGEPGLTDTDWQDEIFRTALTHDHNLSVSGRGQSVNYFVSANYHYKEGTIIESDFEKYSFRLNLDGHHNAFKYGVNFSPSYSESDRVNASGSYDSEGVVQSALASVPLWPVRNADGSYNFQGNGYWRQGTDYQHNAVLNPVALAKLKTDHVTRMAMTGRAFLSYEIIKGLTLQTSLSGTYYGAHNDKYRPSELPLIGKEYLDKPSNPVGYSSASHYYNWLWENQLTFSRDFGHHSINAVLVQSAQKETSKMVNVTATDYPNDYIQTIGGGTVSDGDSKTNQWSLASWLARVQYSYLGRYMLSAALRADGSSRFGKNNRWGYFPSASVAWRLSGEPFFQKSCLAKHVDDFKLRASYGQTGNFQIGNYQHLSTMAADDYIIGAGNGTLAQGYKPTGINRPDLTWEKTSMINIGADLTAWGGYLSLTAEYYNSTTTDMLLNVPVPQLTGYSTDLMNVGKVNNRGWELSVGSRHSYANGLSYSFTANWARNVNEVKALGANDTPIITTCSTAHDFFITKVGEPIGSYYLLVQDGVFQNDEELKAYPHFGNTQAGDFRFVDVDGDGVLDADKDRAIVGNYMPDFTYGFGGSIAFKGIDLSFAFQGVYGNEILNLNRRYIDSVEGNVNMMTETLGRWQSEDNPGNGQVNRANRKAKGNNGRTSTWHLEDGSYLRLQNLAIGYTLPSVWTKKFAVEKLRVYVSGQNLCTWTSYTGYNPEVSLSTSALTPGVDYGTYPLSRTFMFGLNVTF